MAALATVSHWKDLNDAKIASLSTDTGAAPTYAAAIDIPGIVRLSFEPNVSTQELNGDGVTMETSTTIKSWNFSVDHAEMSLDALKVLLGGTITPTAETTQTYTWKGGDVPGYFKIEGQAKDADVGDVHIVLYKCKIERYSVTANDGNGGYGSFSFSGKAIPCAGSGKQCLDIVYNSQDVAIS